MVTTIISATMNMTPLVNGRPDIQFPLLARGGRGKFESAKLTRMRGATLQAGQFLSIQGIFDRNPMNPPEPYLADSNMPCRCATASSAACKIAAAHRRWRCVLYRAWILVRRSQPYKFCCCLDRAGPVVHHSSTRAGPSRLGRG